MKNLKVNNFLVCNTKKIENFTFQEKYKLEEIVDNEYFMLNDKGFKVGFDFSSLKNMFREFDYINNHGTQQDIEVLKEGDNVLIKPSFFNSFLNHCEDETEIPLHNHGKVLFVNKKHKWRHNSAYSMSYLVKIELPNKEVIELFNDVLIRLY